MNKVYLEAYLNLQMGLFMRNQSSRHVKPPTRVKFSKGTDKCLGQVQVLAVFDGKAPSYLSHL